MQILRFDTKKEGSFLSLWFTGHEMEDNQMADSEGWLRGKLLDMKNIFSNNPLKHSSVQGFKAELCLLHNLSFVNLN